MYWILTVEAVLRIFIKWGSGSEKKKKFDPVSGTQLFVDPLPDPHYSISSSVRCYILILKILYLVQFLDIKHISLPLSRLLQGLNLLLGCRISFIFPKNNLSWIFFYFFYGLFWANTNPFHGLFTAWSRPPIFHRKLFFHTGTLATLFFGILPQAESSEAETLSVWRLGGGGGFPGMVSQD
jgi:hypothetical protein